MQPGRKRGRKRRYKHIKDEYYNFYDDAAYWDYVDYVENYENRDWQDEATCEIIIVQEREV